MITREAIVLAGGLGTRIRQSLPDIPKCMAPVNGKPFMAYILDYLIEQGISKVILSVAFRKDHIINYFGNIYKSLEITYSVEDKPLGTGGAIKQSLRLSKLDDLYVINGDTYFHPDLSAMENLHYSKSADITIAVKEMSETARYGLIYANEDGRIIEFKEKVIGSQPGWINGGIYLINRRIIDFFHEKKFSIENKVFKESCSKFKIHAFQTDAFFLDIGIPEDYIYAQTLITSTGKA
jgi:D-glycero-alpha-D-manno-heptose 1-phosphate guanylyltransferase